MEVKLNQKNILKMLALYRAKPLLWDMSDKFYRRNDLKNKAFADIAKDMDMAVDVVKKIRNLRNTYTNERRKMMMKKSGSGLEEQYITSLPWYSEMSFLDSSIVTRKTTDNSEEIVEEIECLDESVGFHEYFGNEISNETPRKKARKETIPVTQKVDEVLQKIMQEHETEFTSFGTTVGLQLSNMNKEAAYELMNEIQSLICQKKIQELRRNAIAPIAPVHTSTPSSDILCMAVTEAEIGWDSE